ncbi:T9SS type A sorting domain-containing protein [Lutibacter sp. Hel_I_33_5]|uniref:T9SS type A sorting domain-containing protein n=1 Tax=Lutibacter sp. Hel_I_33_5 TaxID=1566289 RepID=UPI0011A59C5F|nr:T9SS type A sorting domain-containing protein [Lutibacter sp. Hel_I_33_5]
MGDIGNNKGNRTDLTIYKIEKEAYKNSTSVNAEIISFSYEDQTDFTINTNNHNFDAEAIVVYHNDLLIFTKNWKDLKTNVYKLPIAKGNYSAKKISTGNIEGLITGATYPRLGGGNFFLCGYDANSIPFLVIINQNRKPGDDIFYSSFEKISLENELGQGSQIEAITSYDFGKMYISREFLSTAINGNTFNFPQKLYQFEEIISSLLSTKNHIKSTVTFSPNPVTDILKIYTKNNINSIVLYNSLGKKINELKNINHIDTSNLPKGIYFIKVSFEKTNIYKKIIKL